jgi:predicted dienelactone hydrolase
LVAVVVLTAVVQSFAQQNRIDGITPMAPEQAARGSLSVGVRTIAVVDRGRADVLNTKAGGVIARRDRTLTVELWYPAVSTAGTPVGCEYRTVTRDASRAITLRGTAVRDAAPAAAAGGYPLVILSHGYPGNRFLLGHLGEHLASKGYVVASVDHPESTYDDQKGFASTLYNRPLDQLCVLNEIDRLSRVGGGGVPAGLVDASRTAIIGYSMGGYGLLNVLGAGFSDASVTGSGAPANNLLFERAASNPAFPAKADPRIRAAVALAPWGLPSGAWDTRALAAITTPVLFVAGSADDVSGYERGTRACFLGATGADRYLLTFLNGSHNVAAPIPAPAEAYPYSEALKLFPFMHYADAVWDTVRSNNILQHFVTVFLSRHLKGELEAQSFLDLIPRGGDGVYSVERDGRQKPDHTYWKGFKPRTAAGLTFERRLRGQ